MGHDGRHPARRLTVAWIVEDSLDCGLDGGDLGVAVQAHARATGDHTCGVVGLVGPQGQADQRYAVSERLADRAQAALGS